MESGDHGDHRVHEETWRGFIKIITYSVIGIAGALALMALFLL